LLIINILCSFKKINKKIKWGLGIGDWGLGIGDWAQSPIPNPQSPIPNPQFYFFKENIKYYFFIFLLIILIFYILIKYKNKLSPKSSIF